MKILLHDEDDYDEDDHEVMDADDEFKETILNRRCSYC